MVASVGAVIPPPCDPSTLQGPLRRRLAGVSIALVPDAFRVTNGGVRKMVVSTTRV